MCVVSRFRSIPLCNPMDCSPPGSSVHGILQARMLEWVAIPSSRGSSWLRDWTLISYISCTDSEVKLLSRVWLWSHGSQEPTRFLCLWNFPGKSTRIFQIRKGVHQGYILSPCLFNLYTEYIMRNDRLEEPKLESRLPGEISLTSDMTPLLWQKARRN